MVWCTAEARLHIVPVAPAPSDNESVECVFRLLLSQGSNVRLFVVEEESRFAHEGRCLSLVSPDADAVRGHPSISVDFDFFPAVPSEIREDVTIAFAHEWV